MREKDGGKLFRCDRGHEFRVSRYWRGAGRYGKSKRVPMPKKMFCWVQWEDDICGLQAEALLKEET